VSRPNWQLRDAALGYASRGIPVLPLHYPLPHRSGLHSVTGDQTPWSGPAARVGIRAAASQASTPWATWFPTGSRTPPATGPGSWPGGPTTPRPTSAWPPGTASTSWTSTAPPAPTPSENSSLPMTCRVLGRWCAPAAVAGISILLLRAWGTSAPRILSMWIGAARVAMWSPHPAATPPATPTNGPPAATSTPHPARYPRCCSSGSSLATSSDHQGRSRSQPSLTARVTAMRGRPWPRSWPGSPPRRSATGTASCGSRPATSTTWSPPAPLTTARSTRRFWMPLSAVGCWPRSRARLAAPWPPAARSALPTPAAHDNPQPRTYPPLADPADSTGRRTNPGEEVRPLAAAGHPAG
jgi:hypothetical protein